jgi:hypothetical protein
MLQLYNRISKLHQHEYTRLDSQCILQQFRSVRSSDPLGASFFTTQGLFFFFFFFFFLFALFLSKSTTTTASPAVPKYKACSIQKKRQADAHLCPNPLTKTVVVAIFSAPKRKRQGRWPARWAGTSKFCAYSGGLQPAFASAVADWEPIPLPPSRSLSQADDTVLLSAVIDGDNPENFPKNSKIPQSRIPAKFWRAEFRTYATRRDTFFFSNCLRKI